MLLSAVKIMKEKFTEKVAEIALYKLFQSPYWMLKPSEECQTDCRVLHLLTLDVDHVRIEIVHKSVNNSSSERCFDIKSTHNFVKNEVI